MLAEAGVDLVDRIYYAGGSALGKGREMTQEMLSRHGDLDFLYYSNDMIAAGGLLYCIEKGLNIPDDIGLAGFNAVEILDGLPMQLATMDTRRHQIGEAAARIIAARVAGEDCDQIITLDSGFEAGQTMRAL